MSYNTELQANNEELQSILNTVNALPNADSGGDIDLGVTGATVGQTVKISSVDENGVPTAWMPADFPSGVSGNKMEKIIDFIVTEEVSEFEISTDMNGNAFELREFIVWFKHAVAEKGSYPHWAITGLPGMNKEAKTNFSSWGCYCKVNADGTRLAFEGDQSNLTYSDARLYPIEGLASYNGNDAMGTKFGNITSFRGNSFGQKFVVNTRLVVYGVRV